MTMRRNYKIKEHRIYHAWRRTADFASDAAPIVWNGFLRPVLVLAVGVGLSAPVAKIAGVILARFM